MTEVWILATWGALAAAPVRDEPRLKLDVSVVEAMEGGPLTLHVTLSNTGKKRVEYHHSPWHRSSIDPPKGWSRRLKISGNGISGPAALDPGSRLSETVHLHHHYHGIEAGKVRLKVWWRLPHPRRGGGLTASPSAIVEIDIPRATEANVAALRRRLFKELDRLDRLEKDDKTWEQYHLVAGRVHDAYHPGLIPVAFRLLTMPDGEYERFSKGWLVEDVYGSAAEPQQAHDLFVRHLLSDHPAGAEKVFDFWCSLRHQASIGYLLDRVPTPRDITTALVRYLFQPDRLGWTIRGVIAFQKASKLLLPEADRRRLLRAPSIWVRALAYATFGERCDREWSAGLLDNLRRLNSPLPPAEFDRLVRRLDDNRFAVRERAAAELLRRGDVVAPALRKLLARRPSLEVERRARLLLAEVEKQPLDWSARRTIRYLGWRAEVGELDRFEARAILETLSKGMPEARLTKEAAAALERSRKSNAKRK